MSEADRADPNAAESRHPWRESEPVHGRRGPSGIRRVALLALGLSFAAPPPAMARAAVPPAQAAAGLRPIDSPQVLVRIDSLRNAGSLREASDLAQLHTPAARAAGDSVLLLQLVLRRGTIEGGLGRAREAEASLREALALAEPRGDSAATCSALRWLGVSLSFQGRNPEASACFQRLLAIATESGDTPFQGWAHIGLGWQEIQAGRSAAALDHYRAAITLMEGADALDGISLAWNGSAHALYALGEFEQALAAYRLAAEFARKNLYPATRQFLLNTILNNLAALEYNFGDPSAAAEHFREASKMQLAAGNKRAAISPGLNIALCLGDLNRLADAEDELEKLERICREENYLDMLGAVLTNHAMMLRRQNRREEAGAFCRRALALGEHSPLRYRVFASRELAGTLHEADSNEVALAVLDAANLLLERTPDVEMGLQIDEGRGDILLALGRARESLPLLLRVAEDQRQLGILDQGMHALTSAARACNQLGWTDSARVLLDRAAIIWESDRGIPLDPQWREQRGAWSREVYADLAVAMLESPADEAPHERARKIFNRLQVFKARTFMERVRGPLTTASAESDSLSRSATVEILQSRILRPGELLLDAYLGPRASLLLAVTREDCRVVRLPGDVVLGEVLRLHYRLLASPPPPDSVQSEGLRETVRRNLRAQIFGQVNDLLRGARRVIIAPDGAMNLAPLSEILLDVDSADRTSSGVTPEVVRIPSVAHLIWTRQHPELTQPGDPSRILAIAAEHAPNRIDLPGATAEVQRLARSYRHVDAVTVGQGTTSTRLPELLTGYDGLHLAAHAEMDERNPWRSAIVLDPERRETWLHADQIAAMRLPMRLAVLSSCTSAGGQVLSGEGVLGLSHAFLSAGVQSVLATLWPVDDRATARFMDRFYIALAEGKNAGSALAAAQRDLREEPRTGHPYYWAGFVLTGSGDTRLDLAPRRRFADPQNLLLLLALIPGLAIAFLRWVPRNEGDT